MRLPFHPIRRQARQAMILTRLHQTAKRAQPTKTCRRKMATPTSRSMSRSAASRRRPAIEAIAPRQAGLDVRNRRRAVPMAAPTLVPGPPGDPAGNLARWVASVVVVAAAGAVGAAEAIARRRSGLGRRLMATSRHRR